MPSVRGGDARPDAAFAGLGDAAKTVDGGHVGVKRRRDSPAARRSRRADQTAIAIRCVLVRVYACVRGRARTSHVDTRFESRYTLPARSRMPVACGTNFPR